mmetsp:Transcript_417/g.1425  ORF Transcript_417/g.1425 Transcript_417/m.1425 type:complete len:230 (-) Transcript_417:213-902(-)
MDAPSLARCTTAAARRRKRTTRPRRPSRCTSCTRTRGGAPASASCRERCTRRRTRQCTSGITTGLSAAARVPPPRVPVRCWCSTRTLSRQAAASTCRSVRASRRLSRCCAARRPSCPGCCTASCCRCTLHGSPTPVSTLAPSPSRRRWCSASGRTRATRSSILLPTRSPSPPPMARCPNACTASPPPLTRRRRASPSLAAPSRSPTMTGGSKRARSISSRRTGQRSACA